MHTEMVFGQTLQVALPQFQLFLIVVGRVAGLLAAWPIVGSRVIPLQIKTALVVLLGFVLAPLVRATALPDDPLVLTGDVAGEFLIGLVIGVAVRVVFAGIELAGELIGTQMGLGVVQLFDPTTTQHVPLVGQFHTLLASLVFLSLNAHLVVVRAIAESFDLVPPLTAALSPALGEHVLRVSSGLFAVALKLAAPVLLTVLVVNLAMAVIGRAVPQMNVFVSSFPVTIGLGLVIMSAALPYGVGLFQHEFERLPETVRDLLRGLGHG
ncbi:flagellar biosynthetic protein FliR [Candidatus Nitrospira bockiana]